MNAYIRRYVHDKSWIWQAIYDWSQACYVSWKILIFYCSVFAQRRKWVLKSLILQPYGDSENHLNCVIKHLIGWVVISVELTLVKTELRAMWESKSSIEFEVCSGELSAGKYGWNYSLGRSMQSFGGYWIKPLAGGW